MAIKFAATGNLSHKQWLTLRKTGIGGSEAGAVCGMNPYRSAFSVYMDKVSESITEQDSESMRQGRDLEDYCARRFSESTGLKVRRSNYIYRHKKYDFMIADIDRVIVGENAGLECKTTSVWAADRWKSLDTVPESYLLQCQHYMAVMDYDAMYLACVVLGNSFVYYKIYRNEELINNLICLEQNFWVNHVLPRIIPEPDGSKTYDDVLNGYFTPSSTSPIPLVGFDKDLQRRKEVSQMMTKLEKERKCIDQKLKLFLGDSQVAENEKYRISWKLSESTGVRRFIVKEIA